MVCEAIGDTYSGLLEHSLKKSNQEDATFVIEEAFKLLFDMAGSKSSVEQRAASSCILRIIKASPSSYFNSCSDFLARNLIEVLGKRAIEAAQYTLESILSLVLTSGRSLSGHTDDLLGVLVQHVASGQAATRKAALDTILALCVVSGDEMRFYREEMLETLAVVKSDPDRRVREAALETLQAVQSLADEMTESEIVEDSRLQTSALNQARAKIRTTNVAATAPLTNSFKDDKKKGKSAPKREGSALNKKNINPNFMKATSSEIEIYFHEKKPTYIPPDPPVDPIKTESTKVANPRVERGGATDRSQHTIEFMESRIENEAIAEPISMADTRVDTHAIGLEQPSHIPMGRGADESNIFKDFENDRDLVSTAQRRRQANAMDEERKRSPINRRAPEQGFDVERFQRTATPDREFRHPIEDDRRRKLLTDEDHIIDKLVDKTTESIHQKIVKTNDYEIKTIKKTCEGLKKENAAQLKIIEFQSKRIDSLVSHVQNMTLHINHLLGKVNQLEQNMFQISASRQQSPQQIIVPSYGFQLPGATQPLDQVQMQGSMAMPQQMHPMGQHGGHPLQMNPAAGNMGYGSMYPVAQTAGQKQWNVETAQPDPNPHSRPHFSQNNAGGLSQNVGANPVSFARLGQSEESSGKAKARDAGESPGKPKAKQGRWHAQVVEEVDDENLATDRFDHEKGTRDVRVLPEGNGVLAFSKKKANGPTRVESSEGFGIRSERAKFKGRELGDLDKLDDNRLSANFMNMSSTVQGGFDEERGSHIDNLPRGNFDTGELEPEEFEDEQEEETNEANESLKAVLVKDNRKILDFLADDSNLNQFSLLSSPTIQRLAKKLAELLLCRIESYIEIVIPWLIACIESRSLKGSHSRRDLSSSLRSVLTAGKGSKTYKQELLQTLEALKRDLEKQ